MCNDYTLFTETVIPHYIKAYVGYIVPFVKQYSMLYFTPPAMSYNRLTMCPSIDYTIGSVFEKKDLESNASFSPGKWQSILYTTESINKGSQKIGTKYFKNEQSNSNLQ